VTRRRYDFIIDAVIDLAIIVGFLSIACGSLKLLMKAEAVLTGVPGPNDPQWAQEDSWMVPEALKNSSRYGN
jgi:hypothetical protein